MPPKTIAEARTNFEAALPAIGSRYDSGVSRADWQGPASSEQSEANFAAGVGAAIAAKSRQNRIRQMSNADWQQAARTKGAPIIGERIRGSLDKWQANFGPIYDQVVSTVSRLPARTTDYRANIQNRLVAVVEQWKRAAGKL